MAIQSGERTRTVPKRRDGGGTARADRRAAASPRAEPTVTIAPDASVLDAVKRIADAYRAELGFHTRQSFLDSLSRRELLVACLGDEPVGFVRFHRTRSGHTTLQEIATSPRHCGHGVGRRLVTALVAECRRTRSPVIRLSCPVELSANRFYASLGFRRGERCSRPGKSRPLYQWEYPVRPERALAFVASLSNAGNDLRNLLPLWEREGPGRRPFDHCIISPLFAEPRSIEYVRHMLAEWGVSVWFDSGGFFVQQEKIRYEELFVRLLDFYCKNDWAAVYVLPDYVPTSRSSPGEVDERVRVTAAEGAKFFKRLPEELRVRSLGVMQGHSHTHLRLCLNVFLDVGIRRLGFGSFDTRGENADINILTQDATVRLEAVRALIEGAHRGGRTEDLADLHLFGVGSPNLIGRFAGYGTSSFDSSGWMRTAGYGNVYLPFQGRRNVTHGASAVTSGRGLTAQEFYAMCEATKHSCPFCEDYGRLQTDRFARMWHNAIVFGEMTRAIDQGHAEPQEDERE